MSESFDHELISAYYDGQLSAVDRVRVERLLQENPACQAYLDDLHLIRADLRALPKFTIRGDLLNQVLCRAERALLEENGDAEHNQATAAESNDLASIIPATHSKAESGPAEISSEFNGGAVGEVEPLSPAPNSPATPSSQSSGKGNLSRWDAPLWLALAASVCLYLSLAGSNAGRVPTDSGPGAVAVTEPDVQENPRIQAEWATKSAAPVRKSQELSGDSQDGREATPNSTADVELQLSDGNRRSGSDLKSAMHDRAAPMEEGLPQVEPSALRRGSAPGPENKDAVARELAKALASPGSAGEGNVEREADALKDPVVGNFETPVADAERQNLRQEKAALEALHRFTLQAQSEESPIGKTVDLLRSQIVLCEVEATPDVFFAQFEQVLETESIAVATDTGNDRLADAPLAASVPQADHRNEQKQDKQERTAGRSASEVEVRVYMLQADSAHLTRAISRLEQLPEVRLRLSPLGNHRFDTAEVAESPTPLSKSGQFDEQAAGKGSALDAPPLATRPSATLPLNSLPAAPASPHQVPAGAPASPAASEFAYGGAAASQDGKDGHQFKAFGGNADKPARDRDSLNARAEAKSLRLVPPDDGLAGSASPPDFRRNTQAAAGPERPLPALGRSAAQKPMAASSPELGDSSARGRLEALPESGKISQAIIVVRVRPRPIAASAFEAAPALLNKAPEDP